MYFESIGWDKNVLIYDNYRVNKRPRSENVVFDITNMDYEGFKRDITSTIANNNKRGILLVGNPGTGKTSILLKLENDLRTYPVIYVSSSQLNDEYSIAKLSEFIKNMAGSIVIIEDMDTLEVADKTKKFGPLLQLFDNSRADSSVVFIASINNAELIDESLIRTGRFDQIIDIKEHEKSLG